MAHYHILSIDGGGIRGILTARILERIDQAVPGFLSRVHLFAGTSTGGLLALGLAAGLTPTVLRQMYETFAQRIFADTLLDNLKDLGNLVGAQFSAEPLKEVLQENFGCTTLAQLEKKVLIATFKLDNEAQGRGGLRAWKMKFFQNYPGPGSDENELVVEVGVRTSVAPAYFPVYQGYIDGGVAASNPAMCALAQALNKATGRQNVTDVTLLSMGTGINPHFLPVQEADWGIAQWAPHLLDIMLEGDQDLVDYQCRQVLDEQYHRINPVLPRPIDLGAIKYIPELLAVAEQVDLQETIAWIKRNF